MIISSSLALVVAALAAAPLESLQCRVDEQGAFAEITAAGSPVLRYHYGATPVPAGIDPAFERGGYVSAVYGLDGELLTADFPLDHVHHRAVNWTWGTTAWKGEMRDMYAVRNPHEGDPIIGGLWNRPMRVPHCSVEDGVARIDAESRWMWDDETPIVHEWARIEVIPLDAGHRALDFTIRLVPLVDGLEFAGRLEHGYSGFNIRMAPGEGQRIHFHNDPPESEPVRAHAAYSARFEGREDRSGLVILQHPSNPDYPNEWRAYPELNFFQPIYPGGKLVPMPKGEPIVLRFRLVVHRGELSDAALAQLWDQYQSRPTATPGTP